MIRLDGKQTAAAIRSELAVRAAAFEEERGRKAGLAVLLVGEDPASGIYVRNKVRACEEVGIRSVLIRLPEDVGQADAEEAVLRLAEDRAIDGILVQLPLPASLDAGRILEKIPAKKDVDGISAQNMGRLARREPCLTACTPQGIMELLSRYGVVLRGKHAVVVGRSNIVGRPMALLLLNADCTVTVCHSYTQNLKDECLRADILIAAVGRPHLITTDMVKEGAAVVDVGMNRIEGKLCGDVAYEEVSKKASYITPVPGGVGPMTVAMLLKNTLDAAEQR